MVDIRVIYDEDQKPIAIRAKCDCGWMVSIPIHSKDLADIVDASDLHLFVSHDIRPVDLIPPIDHDKRHA